MEGKPQAPGLPTMEKVLTPHDLLNAIEHNYGDCICEECRHRLKLPAKDPTKHFKKPKFFPKRIYSLLTHTRVIAFLLFVLLSVLILFNAQTALEILILGILFLAASFSTIYKPKIGIPFLGIELVTFGTVITALTYNPGIGFLFGFTSSLAESIISKTVGGITILYMITMGLVGAFAGYFDIHIVLLGLLAMTFILIITQTPLFIFGDVDIKAASVLYIISNIIFNAIMFIAFGEKLVNLLV